MIAQRTSGPPCVNTSGLGAAGALPTPERAERLAAVAPPTAQAFRHALGHFATGVTVITSLDEDGALCGMTVSAFSSVSLSPPLVLACVAHDARCGAAIARTGRFAVHILHGSQGEVAYGFASKSREKATVCPWTVNERGFAMLESFHAALECRLHEAVPAGDHAIVLGLVEALHTRDQPTSPLLYHKGKMFAFDGGAG